LAIQARPLPNDLAGSQLGPHRLALETRALPHISTSASSFSLATL
jgi:hypothetical protein